MARRAAGLALVAVSGCGDLLGPDGQQTRQTLSLNALDVENNATFVETGQNDRFATADLIALADEEQIISGHIEDATSVDVYDLGPIAIGDRIVVDLVTSESLKGAIAIFDDTGTAILVNDHRNVYLGRSDPFVDIISMHNTDACYVAVAPTPGFPSAGPYALVATKQRGVPLPEQRPDTILLDFSGAVGIAFGGRPPVDIPPFDAARLAPRFAGETDELTAR
ncbi:MAG: hypothetical protein ACE5E6_05455, partial [Phycisphaerae bacterium]